MKKNGNAKHLGVIQAFGDPGYLLSLLADKPTKENPWVLTPEVFPVLLHSSYSAGATFRKGKFVALFSKPFFLQGVLREGPRTLSTPCFLLAARTLAGGMQKLIR